jgi:hypothetical protein
MDELYLFKKNPPKASKPEPPTVSLGTNKMILSAAHGYVSINFRFFWGEEYMER